MTCSHCSTRTAQTLTVFGFGLVLLAATLPLQKATALTTVILVRHAERGLDTGVSSPLIPTGEKRARDLARTANEAGVQAIFATQYLRTQQTVRPLADSLHLDVGMAPSDQPEDLAKTILTKHLGGVVLVAGHSDTIPRLAKALGVEWTEGRKVQYDDLYVATISESGTARLVTLKYGEPALPEK